MVVSLGKGSARKFPLVSISMPFCVSFYIYKATTIECIKAIKVSLPSWSFLVEFLRKSESYDL